MFKADRKTGPGKGEVTQHALTDRAQTTLFGELVQRLGLLRRPVVVDIAVGERQAVDAPGMAGGENLGDRAAAVIGDDVDLVQAHRIAERNEHVGLRIEVQILVGAGSRLAMSKDIDRDATPDIGQPLDHPVPEVAVEEYAVNENRCGPFAISR